MDKTCPRCGARYPSMAAYCDQDGATLTASPASPRRRRWRRAAIAVAVLLCLAAGAFLPRMIALYLGPRINVALDEVRYLSTTRGFSRPGTIRSLLGQLAGLIDLLTGDHQIAIRLRVRNDTPLQVSLASTTYTITVEGIEAASGVWNPDGKPVLFAPGDEITAEIFIPPSPEAGMAISRALFEGHRPEIQVHGQLTVDALWTTFTLPFEVDDLQIDPESLEPPPKPAAPPPASREDGSRQVA